MSDATASDTARLPRLLLAAALPLLFGAIFGHQAAYAASVGGMGVLGEALNLMIAGAFVVLAGMVGAVAFLWAGGRGRNIGRVSLAIGALAAAGTLASYVLTPGLGCPTTIRSCCEAQGQPR